MQKANDDTRPKAERNRPKAKRNREILEALAAHETPRKVAARHGITKKRVSRIKRRAIRRGEYPPEKEEES